MVRARDILARYYRSLIGRLSEDVVAEEEIFDSPSGARADDLVEMYASKLCHVTTVLNHLEACLRPAPAPAPEKKPPPPPDAEAPEASRPAAEPVPVPEPAERACPDCHGRMPAGQAKCPRCGWSPE
jgi:hypothetical protein